ncbi:girdin-like [Diabrotica virgifera virgifera]|uniref:Girdin-like n=1 Tax=Diabrotica virgifera virgifera TaxID=50390 RepID=A0A6P7FHQ3_DIAVI|nr:girdin-like [Diabrotica virgifera virgifera]
MELENSEILKHIKHLENQNKKLRTLLDTTKNVASQEVERLSLVQTETKSLEKAVDDLEKEKQELDELLTLVLSKDEGNKNLILMKLEREHTKLSNKLDEAHTKIQLKTEEVVSLRTEDAILKDVIYKLEATKKSLLGRIKLIEDKESVLSAISTKLKEQLSEVEHREEIIVKKVEEKNGSSEMLRSNKTTTGSNLDTTKVMHDGVSSNSIMSPNEQQSTYTDNSLSLEQMISELEKSKGKLYKDLEEIIDNSTKEIEIIKAKISDPDIKQLLYEIDIQKAVLVYNLKMARLQDEKNFDPVHCSLIKISSNPNNPVSETSQHNINTSCSEKSTKYVKEKEFTFDILTKALEKKMI